MRVRTAVLVAAAAAVGTADILAARSVYLKKKAAVLRDMAIMSIDETLRKKPESSPDADPVTIPIE